MKTKYFKIIAILISFCLAFEQSGFAQIAGQMDISSYVMGLGRQVAMDKFRPLHLRSIGYDQAQNNFHLLLDKGDAKDLNPQFVKDSTQQLLKYFLVGVTLPNDSFWVNLKPDAPDNVIEENLARTEVGRILLESDLQLKKDTAQATSPETPEGKRYWELLYKKAAELFGNDNVTIPTLVRPWIVPDEIIIRESDSTAYIYKATLKVMLEEDYLKNSGLYNFKDPRLKALNEYSARLIRESIIPKLNRQVNSAKRYAALRQVYYSIILAQWFKSRLSGRNNAYSALIDRRNLANLIAQGNWSVRSYFDAYRKSFQEGEYNLKENIYTPYGQNIRTYTSGGIALQDVFRSEPPPAGGKNVFSSPVHIIDMRAIQDETALAASPNIISAVTSGAEVEKVEVKSNPPVSQGSSPLTMREVNLKMLEAFVERGPEAFSIAANRAVLVAISQGLNFYTDEIGSLSDKIASAGNKNASSDKRALSEYASALSTLLEINPRFSSTNLSTIDIYDDLRNFMHEIAHINFFIQVAEVSLTETPGVYDKLTQLDKHHLNYEALRTIARWERFAYFDTETVGRFFSAISRHINDSKASLKEIEAILKNSPETVEPGATKFFLESLLEQEKKAKRDLEQLGEMQRELNAPVKREPLDVVSLVKDVVASYNGALQVEFVWDTPDEGVYVLGNRRRLSYVWSNLIENADNAINRYRNSGHDVSGRIKIGIRKNGDSVDVSVTDNGRGIAEKMLAGRRLFMAGETDTEGGTGTGLSLAESVVKAHGGSIDANSNGPGTGATFTVRLPIAQGSGAATLAQSTASSPVDASAALRQLQQLKSEGNLTAYISAAEAQIAILLSNRDYTKEARSQVYDELVWWSLRIRSPGLIAKLLLYVYTDSYIEKRKLFDPLLEKLKITTFQIRDILSRVVASRKYIPQTMVFSNDNVGEGFDLEGQLQANWYYNSQFREEYVEQISSRLAKLNAEELYKLLDEEIKSKYPGTNIVSIIALGSYLYGLKGFPAGDLDLVVVVDNPQVDYVSHEISAQGRALVRGGWPINFIDASIKSQDFFESPDLNNPQAEIVRSALSSVAKGTGIVVYGKKISDKVVPESNLLACGVSLSKMSVRSLDPAGFEEGAPVNKRFSKAYKRLWEAYLALSQIEGVSIDREEKFIDKLLMFYEGILGEKELTEDFNVRLRYFNDSLVNAARQAISRRMQERALLELVGAGNNKEDISSSSPVYNETEAARVGEYRKLIKAVRTINEGRGCIIHALYLKPLIENNLEASVEIRANYYDEPEEPSLLQNNPKTQKRASENPYNTLKPPHFYLVVQDAILGEIIVDAIPEANGLPSDDVYVPLGVVRSTSAELARSLDEREYLLAKPHAETMEGIKRIEAAENINTVASRLAYVLSSDTSSSPITASQEIRQRVAKQAEDIIIDTLTTPAGGGRRQARKVWSTDKLKLPDGTPASLENFLIYKVFGIRAAEQASLQYLIEKESFSASEKLYWIIENIMDNPITALRVINEYIRQASAWDKRRGYSGQESRHAGRMDKLQKLQSTLKGWIPLKLADKLKQYINDNYDKIDKDREQISYSILPDELPYIVQAIKLSGLNAEALGRDLLIQLKPMLGTPQSEPEDTGASSPMAREGGEKGGIDFRALPITTQPIPASLGSSMPLAPQVSSAQLDKEWLEIQNMIRSGLIPSAERIKEYAQASRASQDAEQELAKVVSCIADILRMEEEKCVPAEGELTDLLMTLESGKMISELPVVLGASGMPQK